MPNRARSERRKTDSRGNSAAVGAFRRRASHVRETDYSGPDWEAAFPGNNHARV